MLNKTDKIYVAGHRGLVGSAIVRNLKAKGYTDVIGRTHKELDLTNQAAVRTFFETERPDVVVLAAAKVGGINANNTTPAEFAYENMQIQCNVIKCCHDYKVKKLLFLGSTCIYPAVPDPYPADPSCSRIKIPAHRSALTAATGYAHPPVRRRCRR